MLVFITSHHPSPPRSTERVGSRKWTKGERQKTNDKKQKSKKQQTKNKGKKCKKSPTNQTPGKKFTPERMPKNPEIFRNKPMEALNETRPPSYSTVASWTATLQGPHNMPHKVPQKIGNVSDGVAVREEIPSICRLISSCWEMRDEWVCTLLRHIDCS